LSLEVEKMEPSEIKSRILLTIQGRIYDVKRIEKGKKQYLFEVADMETEKERTFIIKSIRLLEAIDHLPQEVARAKEKFLLLDGDEGTWQICDNSKLNFPLKDRIPKR
jgi:hypothetical protein